MFGGREGGIAWVSCVIWLDVYIELKKLKHIKDMIQSFGGKYHLLYPLLLQNIFYL